MDGRQLLREQSIEPTVEIILAGLGKASSAYLRFVEELESLNVEVHWRYYQDGKAWLGKGLYKWTSSRGTPKEINTFWLSIWEGFFKVAFYIPEKNRAEALSLPLTNATKTMIMNAKQVGKLKFFPLVFDLCSGDHFSDMRTLVNFKKVSK